MGFSFVEGRTKSVVAVSYTEKIRTILIYWKDATSNFFFIELMAGLCYKRGEDGSPRLWYVVPCILGREK